MHALVVMSSAQTIKAIKFYRFLTDKGLKDSKDFIEAHIKNDSITYETDTSRTEQEINDYIKFEDTSISFSVVDEKPEENQFNINVTIKNGNADINVKSEVFTCSISIKNPTKGTLFETFNWIVDNYLNI